MAELKRVIKSITFKTVDVIVGYGPRATITSTSENRRFKVENDGISGLIVCDVDLSSSGGISYCGSGNSIFSVSGCSISSSGGSGMSINGVRYSPYKLRHGRGAGKTFMMPNGWTEYFAEIDGPLSGASSPPEALPGMTKYVADGNTTFNLEDVKLTGSSSVTFADASVFTDDCLNISCSGASSVYADGIASLKLKVLDIQCSGASKVKTGEWNVSGRADMGASGTSSINLGGSSADSVKAEASGMSHITRMIGRKRVIGEASGMSEVNLSSLPGARVSRNASGMSTVDIN